MTALARRLPTVLGGGLLVVALLALASSAVEQVIPTDAVVAALGNDYLLLAVVATLLATGLLAVLFTRVVVGVTEATPPPVETVAPETPGRSVDQSLDSLPPIRTTDQHRRIHDRLRRAAVGAVAESTRESPSDVTERVDSGSWTSDDTAAAFVAGEALDPPSVGGRVLARLRGDHWFRTRVRATVAAVERASEDRS